MSRIILVLVCAALLAAVPGHAGAKGLPEPDEGPDPRGLTLAGSGIARVQAPGRLSEQTIARAVQAARPKALAGALAQARRRASALAAAAGLGLGEIRAVTARDESEVGFSEPGPYCTRRPGRRPGCRVPSIIAATLAVTFATTETSAAAPAGRAIVASGSASAPVEPRNRRSSPSIREALLAARLAAVPGAIAAARENAQATARLAGMELGPLFSIAEVRRPFDDLAFGSFGPGRYCGVVRRPTFRRDPATGRRRVVRRVTTRRCYFSRTASLVLRVTFLPR